MNNSITVVGTNRAMMAAAWCEKHFNSTAWTIDISTTLFSNEDYHFKFCNDSEASEFALRWR
jgi:hypothetical protein